MNRLLLLGLAVGTVLGAAACGTRGPLYLPPDATPPKAPQSAPDNNKTQPPASPK